MSVRRLKNSRGSSGSLVTLCDIEVLRKRLRKGIRGGQLEFIFKKKGLDKGKDLKG